MSEKYFPFDQMKIGETELNKGQIVPHSMKVDLRGNDIDVNCMTEGYYVFRLAARCNVHVKIFEKLILTDPVLPQTVVLYLDGQEVIRFRAITDIIYDDASGCSSVTLTGTEMLK